MGRSLEMKLLRKQDWSSWRAETETERESVFYSNIVVGMLGGAKLINKSSLQTYPNYSPTN
jgi:hypothetical protein